MKVGQKVEVYEDPITRQKLEGVGTVFRMHDCGEFYTTVGDLELRGWRCEVTFDEDDEDDGIYSRTVYLPVSEND